MGFITGQNIITYHKIDQPYKVLDWNTGFGLQTGTIQNLEDS